MPTPIIKENKMPNITLMSVRAVWGSITPTKIAETAAAANAGIRSGGTCQSKECSKDGAGQGCVSDTDPEKRNAHANNESAQQPRRSAGDETTNEYGGPKQEVHYPPSSRTKGTNT